jgi:integrase
MFARVGWLQGSSDHRNEVAHRVQKQDNPQGKQPQGPRQFLLEPEVPLLYDLVSKSSVLYSLDSPVKVAGARQRPSIRLYDLRHTCATLLLARNVHPKYVQELLGHASIAQTLDTYSHIIEGMDGGITDAIDEALD